MRPVITLGTSPGAMSGVKGGNWSDIAARTRSSTAGSAPGSSCISNSRVWSSTIPCCTIAALPRCR